MVLLNTIFCGLLRSGTAVLLAFLLCVSTARANVAEGRRLFLDPKKGNCVACHQVPGDSKIKSRAKIGPPLSEISRRFPARSALRTMLWDMGGTVPNTIMPPYGRHRILTESEIDAVQSYIETF